MTLEQQLVSLELAKELKGLGVKRDSLFWWYESNHSIQKSDMGKKLWYLAYKSENVLRNTEKISAYTVAELGEMLPYSVNGFWLTIQKMVPAYPGWIVSYCDKNFDGEIKIKSADTEADARAKMLIYLIKNGLIKSLT